MATIDTNIALGVRPVQIENPMAQYSQIAQIQNARTQNKLAKLQFQNAETEQKAINALNEAYAQAYDPATGKINNNLLRETMARSGFGSKLPGLEKTLLELEKEKLLTQKTQGEVTAQPTELAKKKVELVDLKLKQSRQFLDTINPANPAAPQAYVDWVRASHADPIIGPELVARGTTLEQSLARVQQAIDQGPQAFADFLNQSKLGVEKFMELNKPTTSVVDQSGQKQMFQTPGLGGAPKSVGIFADVPLPANVQAQKIDIARQSRPPAQPPQPQPPVAVVDPLTGKQILVSREEALSKRMTPANAMEGLAPKEIQAREAKFPAATSAVKTFESSADRLAKDLETLATHKGLSGISGLIYGRTPAVTKEARAAKALYDSIVARGGFQELQNMRASSPTGGALGNVSNQEGQYLRDAFAPINLTQDTADLSRVLTEAASATKVAKQRVREAYDMTYDYKGQGGAVAPAPAAGGKVVDFGSLK
jgi:hypothetical protein